MPKKLYIEEEGASRGAPFDNSFSIPWSLLEQFETAQSLEQVEELVQDNIAGINEQISLQSLFSAWRSEDLSGTLQQLERTGKLYILGEEQYFGLGTSKKLAKQAIADAKAEEN